MVSLPKKPISTYMLFYKDMREKILQKNKDLSNVDMAKIVGKKWAELKDYQKKKYHNLSEKDKARYEKEKEEFSL